MTIGTWLRRMALAAAVAALAASCTVPATATPPPTVCDGISSEVGGCVGDRHKFTSSSCDDLAREWAGVLDKSVVANSLYTNDLIADINKFDVAAIRKMAREYKG